MINNSQQFVFGNKEPDEQLVSTRTIRIPGNRTTPYYIFPYRKLLHNVKPTQIHVFENNGKTGARVSYEPKVKKLMFTIIEKDRDFEFVIEVYGK